MTEIRNHALGIIMLSGLLALSDCVILGDVYGDAARSDCENEIDGKSRVDCNERAGEARRERDRNQE
ncbi:hypothetical protein, partial [Hyphomonas sp.]|uniref:hypothetical protein n=1 Tax=Hyphomonas sp. TaxID=87 RepID=UPI0033418C71